MNIGVIESNRVICRFNLRGMCRFGTRCRNIHTSTDRMTDKGESGYKMSSVIDTDAITASLGACALSPRKTRPSSPNYGSTSSNYNSISYPVSSTSSDNRSTLSNDHLTLPNNSSTPPNNNTHFSNLGPSTSSVEEAIELVKKAESADKTCGICFDVIMEKTSKLEQTFGLLPNCSHCFCFTCIRKWRQSKEFELEVAKACPECRIASDFVYPSKHWMENKEEKTEFIDAQKQRMKTKNCRYFRQGKGRCPFGNTCLYLHALPNGKVLDVGPPRPRRRRHSGELMPKGIDNDLVHQILFWLNDEDIDVDDDDDDDDDYDVDMSSPCFEMQYFDDDGIQRCLAMDRYMRAGVYDDSDSECEFVFL